MSKIKQIIKVNKIGNGSIEYAPVDIQEYEVQFDEKALSYSYVMDTMRKTMGTTLTVLDASIPDGKQLKAIKDLIRHAYSDEMSFLADMVYDQDEISKVATEYFEKNKGTEEETVTIEEALGIEE